MIIRVCAPYFAKRGRDATWSIVDMRTREIVLIAESTLPLQHLEESTMMEIMDALRERDLTSTWATSPLQGRDLR
ncbi:hypothetical protein SAMN02927900_04226 [Rhizobium mongolense subsp. loessense]|uniref:Uncharacterized protein n=1 Tax=Rhizobium mongolense subsp. loessense TaxID=158890 RepID=A0A1G4SV49_9HYPH|nr:hypothetical protein SAMN02927900_04226 [Rhizobium mongolense subsp. loessense]